MLWLWKHHPKSLDEIDLEAVISATLDGYGVTDPVEAAWFAMALRELLPVWVAKRVIR